MVKIICGACTKPLSIDESKLPEKEVSFPCPLCKTKLRVDRREIDFDSDEPHTAEVAEGGSSQPAAPPAVEPAAAAEAPAVSHSEETSGEPDAEGGHGKRALIVGENSAEIQQAARTLGYAVVHKATSAEGRDYFLQEIPEVVFVVPKTISQPPMEDLVPLTSVGPSERRRGFFIMVGENLRSLDGNAAFLYGMNLVVGRKDLGAIGRIYAEARRDHDRLARGFVQFGDE